MRLYRRKKKDGSPVWWCSWTANGCTVRKSTRCSTRPAAEIVAARWERERADPVYAAQESATLGHEASVFLTECRSAHDRGKLAAGTLTMYRQKAGAIVRVLGSDTRLATFGPDVWADYLEARRDEGVKESTLYKEWVTFRGILNSARRRGVFGRDPAIYKPAHWGPEYKPRTRFLSWEEIVQLLHTAPESRRHAIAFAIATGARRAEVFAAQAGDVDRKRWIVRLRGTKTDASDRTIPIPRPMRKLLAAAGDPPFPAWGNARRELARYCARVGIEPVTWNDLRRTFASLLVQAGVDPYLVGKLQGHTTSAMVERVYGRQTHETMGALVDRQLHNTREPSVNHQGRKQRDSSARGGHAK